MGGIFLLLTILLLICPLYLFSDLSSEENLVLGAGLTVSIQLMDLNTGFVNTMELYKSNLIEESKTIDSTHEHYSKFRDSDWTRKFTDN